MNSKLATAPPTEPLENYHERTCKICRHPDRAAIEYDFLHWRSPEYIAKAYDFSWRSMYRHAHAARLFDHRRRNLRSALEFLIEGASRVEPTVDGVIRAVQLYARMNDSGEIIEPPKTQVIVISRDGAPPGPSAGTVVSNGERVIVPVASGAKFVQNPPVALELTPVSAQNPPLRRP